MAEKTTVSKERSSADWLMRGALSRLGDTFDQFTGRQWTPSSSLATSELIERLKKLLDAEAKKIPGKGRVVPHNIKLKMQWDKFSGDAEEPLAKLENELLAAAADHINDTLSYTYAPLSLEVKQDYFTEGVKLFASFDTFSPDEIEAELNVTLPAINLKNGAIDTSPRQVSVERYTVRYTLKEIERQQTLEFPAGRRLSIGRTGGNDLILDDESVSKMHASLAVIDGALAVADTGSTNGTFINGERISYGKAMRLVNDDVVKFGIVEVVFEHLESEAAESPRDEISSVNGIEFRNRSPEAALPDDTVKIEPKAGE